MAPDRQVLYVSFSAIPSLTANSIHVMKMCQAMTQEAIPVELWAPSFVERSAAVSDELWSHYGVQERFPIVWTPAHNVLQRRTYAIRAACRAKTLRVALVYTRDLYTAAVASLLGTATVFEVHDVLASPLAGLYFRLLLRGRGFRRLVVITHALHNKLVEQFSRSMIAKDVVVAPDGVDIERFEDLPTPPQARHQLGLESERFTVGYTGHLYAGRGIELVLQLASLRPDMYFLVVGGTPEDVERWRSVIERADLNNIQLVGFIENSRLPLYQAACEVLLMPYQRRVAASSGGNIADVLSPMKMFEYMATGRLIVSSDLPVLREVLNEDNAVLCDPNNVETWETALNRAKDEPKWRMSLGQKAPEDVVKFSWRNRVRRVLSGLL